MTSAEGVGAGQSASETSGSQQQQQRQPCPNGFDPFRDAREIVRLVQCSICSLPLRHPMALPCGNIACRGCLPEAYVRRGVSYPDLPERKLGFICPAVGDCRKEHALADCGVDVTLAKVVEHFNSVLASGKMGSDDSSQEKRFGRLRSLYVLAKDGRLAYDEEIEFDEEKEGDGTDHQLLAAIKEAACSEMECQVCYALLVDPVTTQCGHTFCRQCIQKVLAHSLHCPSCRTKLQLPSHIPAKSSNKRLTEILVVLCPGELADRATSNTTAEPQDEADDLTTPIFVCASSFPSMPTPLFIFEARYRLMIQRAWEGDKLFGMVLPNFVSNGVGDAEGTPFMEYGTMLQIESIQVYADGRSHIWTVGVSKFKIRKWGYRDDYLIAKVERVDDFPLADEEAFEQSCLGVNLGHPHSSPLAPGQTTMDAFRICADFCDRMISINSPWASPNVLLTFGLRPEDPTLLPYWVASILPIVDQEKYRLICSQSVRERLFITVQWINNIERIRWWV
ncbi:PUA-like domain-containing protein [Tricharina praecox]|uniref:PUA-like domain-containing protein n=1 Tax=Tricharina praecox TaxID=43433 RepID=UPI00221FADE9|nr:PUA-like domain-containing protein [Tricharina praecox]XP_051337656.1 PUA-like domain-containing protein [Tricharina praecox]KAI5843651.1 PUA-like domain-containing protein [Tricharina praecox]KAI5848211.1 PUA-like domain-containing protein [Tricharina praecox]